MSETIGTLNLKIARLQHRLKLLQQQQVLSLPYPDHQAALLQETVKVQGQLQHLLLCREQLSHYPSTLFNPVVFNEVADGQESVYAVN